MIETRDTARIVKINIETLESRTMLSSAVSFAAAAAICPASDSSSGMPVQPAMTASSLDAKRLHAMSIDGQTINSELAAAQAAYDNAMAAAMKGMPVGHDVLGGQLTVGGSSAGMLTGSTGGMRARGSGGYNDMDWDDMPGHMMHNSGDRTSAPPSFHEHSIVTLPGETGGSTTVTPVVPTEPATSTPATGSSSSGTSSSSSATGTVASVLNTSAHSTAAMMSAIDAIPPRGVRSTGAVGREDVSSASSVVDSLVARATTGSTLSLGASRLAITGIHAGGEIGSSLTVFFARAAAQYAEAAAAAARIARSVVSFPGDAIPAVGSAFDSVVQTPQRFFHFERMSDPMLLIGDASAAFAEESTLLGTGGTQVRYAKAWGVTAAVVFVDAAVLIYYVQMRRRRAAAASNWNYAMTGGEIE